MKLHVFANSKNLSRFHSFVCTCGCVLLCVQSYMCVCVCVRAIVYVCLCVCVRALVSVSELSEGF